MSRHFHYKTPEDLRAAARALDLPIRLGDNARALLDPLPLGNLTLGNRLVIQPMEGCDGALDGAPGELTFRRFQRFGAGGASLIWGEACAVVPEGRANPRQLWLCERHASRFEALIGECRAAHAAAFGSDANLAIGLQLTHSGRYSHAKPVLAQHDPLLDPRTIVDPATKACADWSYPLVTDDELLRLQDAYVAAARLAQRIGCTFVDIKQCHRYLLNELLAARSRPGRFGGSFENRTRFALELCARIRAECPGLLIASRLNVFDGIPYTKGPDGTGTPVPWSGPLMSCWGTDPHEPEKPDLHEPLRFIKLLHDAGVSLINVSMGNPYASPHLLRPFEYPPRDGYETPEHPLRGVARHFSLTAAIQRAFPTLAVVGSGYSWLQEFALLAAAANVEDRAVSLAGLGRAALSQPDFARRLLEGQPLDRKRTCRTFSYCTALMRSKHNEMGQFATGCPPFDKDVYGPIWRSAQSMDESAGARLPTDRA